MVVSRFLLPLTLAPWLKGVAAVLLLVGSQYHLWCRLSSGSVFSPEFPRAVVMLFTWAFGAILFLALFMLLLDAGTLATMLARHGRVTVPDAVRYAVAASASLLAAVGVRAAIRIPPVKDLTISIRELPPQFDGYRVLHLTDLHISRLFPAAWTRRVVERSNTLGVDLIVVTGDFIDGALAARRADVEPLRDLHAPARVGALRRRWHDALREQRNRAVARLRVAAGSAVGTHPRHAASRRLMPRSVDLEGSGPVESKASVQRRDAG